MKVQYSFIDRVHLMVDSLFDFSEYTMRTLFEGRFSLVYSAFFAIAILGLFWFATRTLYKRFFSKYIIDSLNHLVFMVLNLALLYASLLLLLIPLSDIGFKQTTIIELMYVVDVFSCLLLSFIITKSFLPHTQRALQTRGLQSFNQHWLILIFFTSTAIVSIYFFGLLKTRYYIDPNLIYSINIILFTPLLALAINDLFQVVLIKCFRSKTFIDILSKNLLILFGLLILSISMRYSNYIDLELLNIASLFIAVMGIQIAILLREQFPLVLSRRGHKPKYIKVISNIIGVVVAVNFIGLAIYLSDYNTFKYLSGFFHAITTISITVLLSLFVKYIFIDEITIKHVDSTVSIFLGRLIITLIILSATIIVLDDFNLNTHPLLALLTAGGLAVALALQSSLSNFAAGLWIVIFSPFKLKDKVKINSQLGIIVDIDFLYTRLQKYNGELVIIPNANVLSSVIENIHRSKIYRLPVSVGVAYGSDIKKALKIIKEIIESSEHAGRGIKNAIKNSSINTENNLLYVKSFDDSSICIEFGIWVSALSNFAVIQHDLRMEIIKRFEAENIEIPFNQLDIHIAK